jgi:3-phosphoglycerate kinase
MKCIDQYEGDMSGMRILMRSDFNVPVEKGYVENDFRIRCGLPTLLYLRDRGAQTVIISHIGRDPKESMQPVAAELKKHIPVTCVPDLVGTEAHAAVSEMHPGDIVLLENLRRHPGETKNDAAFTQALARLGDVYVNDAFAASHRMHASIVGVPKLLPAYGGIRMHEEIAQLSHALNPPSPSVCILGGAKFDTKEPLVRKLLKTYDHVFIGGALSNDVFAALGYEIGRSLVSSAPLADDVFHHGRLLVPTDVVAKRSDGTTRIAAADDMREDEKNVDIGPASIDALKPYIQDAKFILWNGPMGIYEEGFDVWTHALARMVAGSGAHSVVGGGDTVAAITELNLEQKFSFLSTGGGAMLEFLLNGTLPGITALEHI